MAQRRPTPEEQEEVLRGEVESLRDGTRSWIRSAVKEAIKAKGLKVDQVAEMMSMSTGALYDRLRGDTSFRFEEVAMIARIIDLPVDDRFYYSPEALLGSFFAVNRGCSPVVLPAGQMELSLGHTPPDLGQVA